MEIAEPRRLYQQLAAELKQRIEEGVYQVGEKLPAERFIADEKNVSRTVVREAIIMLEVEGYVEVRKGSGIHVIASQAKHHAPALSRNMNSQATARSSCYRPASLSRVISLSSPPPR